MRLAQRAGPALLPYCSWRADRVVVAAAAVALWEAQAVQAALAAHQAAAAAEAAADQSHKMAVQAAQADEEQHWW